MILIIIHRNWLEYWIDYNHLNRNHLQSDFKFVDYNRLTNIIDCLYEVSHTSLADVFGSLHTTVILCVCMMLLPLKIMIIYVDDKILWDKIVHLLYLYWLLFYLCIHCIWKNCSNLICRIMKFIEIKGKKRDQKRV
jgi:hypothetical protein